MAWLLLPVRDRCRIRRTMASSSGIWSRDFNAPAYRLQMLNRFPDDWHDKQDVEVAGLLRNFHLSLFPDTLLERIRRGEPVWAVLASATDEVRKLLGQPPKPNPRENEGEP